MAKAKDRSPAAVALAFVERIDPGARHVRVADVAALVRAIRRECARVVSRSNGINDAVDGLHALNRAPKTGGRRG